MCLEKVNVTDVDKDKFAKHVGLTIRDGSHKFNPTKMFNTGDILPKGIYLVMNGSVGIYNNGEFVTEISNRTDNPPHYMPNILGLLEENFSDNEEKDFSQIEFKVSSDYTKFKEIDNSILTQDEIKLLEQLSLKRLDSLKKGDYK